jgi:hypothetical protein
MKDHAKVCVWSQKDNNDNENQLWQYSNGNFTNLHSGKVLDVKGSKVKPEGIVIRKHSYIINRNKSSFMDSPCCSK